MKKTRGKKSLQNAFPEISLEWHNGKNSPLSPSNVSYGSGKNVWWQCLKCDNEWQSTINNRTNNKRGCRKCTDKKTSQRNIDRQLSKANNLLERSPELIAEEWD